MNCKDDFLEKIREIAYKISLHSPLIAVEYYQTYSINFK